MFDYIPDVFKEKYAQSEEKADGWYTDPDNHRRPPELLPRDEVARAINSEVKAGRGSPHGGVFLDVSSRMSAEEIKRRLPSMHHQFLELADVDITAEPMEVGPTCHYVMGGVEVDPDSAAAVGVTGLYAAGEVAGGMHGSNRLGGNSLSDLLVFGRRAGLHAARYAAGLGAHRPEVDDEQLTAARREALAAFGDPAGEPAPGAAAEGAAAAGAEIPAPAVPENPYGLHQELQQTMNDLVGIIRRQPEMAEALERLSRLRERATRVAVEGHRQFNPGWHLALDLRNMLLVSECVARAALERQESRGGHTRDDYPEMLPEWRKTLLICGLAEKTEPGGGQIELVRQDYPRFREDLLALFELSELQKYLTDEELPRPGAEPSEAEPSAPVPGAREAAPSENPEESAK
jgi:succinate dehydrogenase / fumarate reductase flavoprotein subunit